ncbi:hypothetical protein Gotur_030454, partial [Gossypium turneri]
RGVYYTSNREKYHSSRLVFEDSESEGDSLKEGYISDIPERVTSNTRQNNLEDLTKIWKQWDSDTRVIFTENYFWKVERTPFHVFSKLFAPLEAHIEKD